VCEKLKPISATRIFPTPVVAWRVGLRLSDVGLNVADLRSLRLRVHWKHLTLHAEAVKCMLRVIRKMKTEIPASIFHPTGDSE
jgi:hypothetical protein